MRLERDYSSVSGSSWRTVNDGARFGSPTDTTPPDPPPPDPNSSADDGTGTSRPARGNAMPATSTPSVAITTITTNADRNPSNAAAARGHASSRDGERRGGHVPYRICVRAARGARGGSTRVRGTSRRRHGHRLRHRDKPGAARGEQADRSPVLRDLPPAVSRTSRDLARAGATTPPTTFTRR